ncbi:MAG: type II toxin-antitoxin system RelE/ParE family toxin [Acidobacteria bacterium]|nr:type II toxin-antitoxin system RelE/ParE family toxin [Acidobacteriota bacterium]
MSSATIRWQRKAVQELAVLPRETQRRVLGEVDRLRHDPLKGEQLAAEWQGIRRLRVGPHRIVYAFNGSQLLILMA